MSWPTIKHVLMNLFDLVYSRSNPFGFKGRSFFILSIQDEKSSTKSRFFEFKNKILTLHNSGCVKWYQSDD
ncbi:unnamed protein product [Spirodela intermedia]|uniref:Uncharacterized protein n=1 Tax=Spirodela intermedia TaxID=51605 RepID=A0A7I8J5P9_SPIIN|nr:unnamed protein product [Spirodela intermedia]CAA6665374.1 unnamed protein product [Spirodela intermedia]CAA6674176.1 unnamed protein product [Spirodela intermedia]